MKKILILFGGNTYEHNISCQSVNFVINNIDLKLFDYTVVGLDYDNNFYEIKKNTNIDSNWRQNIKEPIRNIIEYLKQFDKIFPVIHGSLGEDGKLQSLFEMFKINFVGCDSFSSLICFDKLFTKLILEKYSIPQVPYVIYNKNANLNKIEFPVIVKPCKCGSSIGISIANNKKELTKSLKKALKYDKNIVIEKFLDNNRELECAIIEKNNKLIISDVGEIINTKKWYDFDSKYLSKTNTIISTIDDSIKKEIKNYSKMIFKILGCKDLCRIDFLYDKSNNKLYFNEINTIPGFTQISMYPKLIMNSKISSKELITILLS